MKLKNIYVNIFTRRELEKIVVVKDVSAARKLLRLYTGADEIEYKCILSGTPYFFSPRNNVALANFMDNKELKKNISSEELKTIVGDKEEVIRTYFKFKNDDRKVGF